MVRKTISLSGLKPGNRTWTPSTTRPILSNGDAWSEKVRDKYYDFLTDHRLEPDNIYRSSPPPGEWVERLGQSDRLRNFNSIYASEDRAHEEEHNQRTR